MHRFSRLVTFRNLGIALGLFLVYHFWHLRMPRVALVSDVDSCRDALRNDTIIAVLPGEDTWRMQVVPGSVAAIGKVTMLYGTTNEMYERSVKAHARHGYPTQILRHEIIGGYWNKPSYLLSLLVAELAKQPEERLRWLLWFDADSILINPKIPLEIFLPPPDFEHIHFLATKDHNGLNTGVFFIRVHPWSVTFLTRSMGLPMYRPDIDLGYSQDQTAMAHVFREGDFGSARLYQPRIWYNTYEFSHGYEGKKGHMLVHFPGLGERWEHMSNWLNIVEQHPTEWEVPLTDTSYLQEINRFWSVLREGRRLQLEANNTLNKLNEEQARQVRLKAELLQQAMGDNSDDPEAVSEATDNLRQMLQIASPEIASPE